MTLRLVFRSFIFSALSLVSFLAYSDCDVTTATFTYSHIDSDVCSSDSGFLSGSCPAGPFTGSASVLEAYQSANVGKACKASSSGYSYLWEGLVISANSRTAQITLNCEQFSPSGVDQGTSGSSIVVFNGTCNQGICQSHANDSLGNVPLAFGYNADGSVSPSVPAGTTACINYCAVTAVGVLSFTAHIASGSASDTSTSEEWDVQAGSGPYGGLSCTPVTQSSTGAGPGGFNCETEKHGVTACTSSPGTIADASDVRSGITGQDFGPSAANQSNLTQDGCVTVATGAAFCISSAANQPDNGTPGQAATPTAVDTLTGPECPTGGTCTFNYYSASQVAGSTNYGGAVIGGTSSGTTAGTTTGTTGGTTSGTTSGTTGGTGNTLSGGSDCTVPPPTCNGDPVACYEAQAQFNFVCSEQIPSSGDAEAQFEAGTGVSGNPQGGLLPVYDTYDAGQVYSNAVGSISGGGACIPDLSINLPSPFNSTVLVPLSQACLLIRLIRALVLLGAVISAFFIVMGAFE